MLGVVSDSDVSLVEVEGRMIEMVEDFAYLGSNLLSDGHEVNCQITKASKAFGSL